MVDDSLKHLWLPYTQMKTTALPLQAVATEGCQIRLSDGRTLIDGVASWWTACHGYNHPHIGSAVARQLQNMPHVMFGGLVHDPAIRLAERLSALMPGDLNRVFLVDSGSVAVEVALKISVQYWLNKGYVGRSRFIHFRHGYHGDTMACMAICDPDEGMHAHFSDWLPHNIIADLPQNDAETAAFDDLLRREKNHVAAVIIEPLVQGAGGMKFHDAATLKRVADACMKHEVLLIADEIFTGFGRTGSMFASEQADIIPDIMCVGKALTGGTLSLAAAIVRSHVFDAFWSDDPRAALMHGPTYMANPLACAASNASLDLFDCEPRLQQVAEIECALRAGLEPCRSMRGVVDVRVKGAIGVIQVKDLCDNAWLKECFINYGVWIRPFGDIIYVTPSLTINSADLQILINALVRIIRQWGLKFY